MRKQKQSENNEFYSHNIVDKVLLSKKISYENLNDLIPEFAPNIKEVTMYIDLYDLFTHFYNPHILEDETMFLSGNKVKIASMIINMVSHYRRYFATRRNLYSTFVFYYNSKVPTNEVESNHNFKKIFRLNRFSEESQFIKINKLIQSSIKLATIIMDYIPRAYIIDSETIDKSLVPYYLIKSYNEINTDEEERKNANIIFSTDRYEILNCVYDDETYLLSTKFGESTFTLNDDLNLVKRYSNDKDYEDDGKIILSKYLIPFMFTMTGYTKFDISGVRLYGEKKTIKFFKRMITEDYLSNIEYNPSIFLGCMRNYRHLDEAAINIMKRNINLFHLPTMFNKLSPVDIEKNIDSKMHDFIDLHGLLGVNSNIFEKEPLNIDDLFLGEEYESL